MSSGWLYRNDKVSRSAHFIAAICQPQIGDQVEGVELLDLEGGSQESRLALPPDREVLADQTAPPYKPRTSGIAVKSKEDIRERIRFSSDYADAVALACWPRHGLRQRQHPDPLSWHRSAPSRVLGGRSDV